MNARGEGGHQQLHFVHEIEKQEGKFVRRVASVRMLAAHYKFISQLLPDWP